MSATDLAGQLAFWEARGTYKNFDNYLQRIKAVTEIGVDRVELLGIAASAAVCCGA